MILLEREKLLSELEQKIGYSFRSRALLDRALTHRSFANERLEERCQHNEALEFLGDSVLGLVVSAWLLERHPELSEGKLSKMKAYLVSEASLVDLAEEIDLGRYILLNRGEEKTGGRQKRALLADAYEALIGVLYISGGLGAAERFLRRELREKVRQIDPASMIGADYKSALQERLQAAGAPVPEYVVVEALGPDHRRTFRVELRAAGRALGVGEGRSIKIAQQEAARAALFAPETIENIFSLSSAECREQALDSPIEDRPLDNRLFETDEQACELLPAAESTVSELTVSELTVSDEAAELVEGFSPEPETDDQDSPGDEDGEARGIAATEV